MADRSGSRKQSSRLGREKALEWHLRNIICGMLAKMLARNNSDHSNHITVEILKPTCHLTTKIPSLKFYAPLLFYEPYVPGLLGVCWLAWFAWSLHSQTLGRHSKYFYINRVSHRQSSGTHAHCLVFKICKSLLSQIKHILMLSTNNGCHFSKIRLNTMSEFQLYLL